MSEPQVLELALRVPRREVLRYLGYPRGRRPRPAIARRLDELWPEASGLLRARGALRLVDRAAAEAAGMPRPSERVAVGACTLGPALEACAGLPTRRTGRRARACG